ncbi:hypothetical protein LOK74_05090 [Brevibacillus humidisoli]|uniref:hypothetical protein n=1 Tax=Brevibacillus humidisoli TaxID=2895522 RepID=UPI001E658D6A|nr:hypothetical protein [Brevibacillus humidisoli]UFJ41881.1 hypothetical protein LOK74_05090 [Brevibacillus humidisoli]
MKLADALFNWLQIKVVADARPDDRSADETVRFFQEILTEDHQVEQLDYRKDDTMYTIRYRANGKSNMQMFPIEAVEQLLESIQNEPKYNL